MTATSLTSPTEPTPPLVLCVWHENQRVPAKCYGDKHAPDNFDIRVCKDAAAERDKLLANGLRAIVYHFNGNGVGGSRN